MIAAALRIIRSIRSLPSPNDARLLFTAALTRPLTTLSGWPWTGRCATHPGILAAVINHPNATAEVITDAIYTAYE